MSERVKRAAASGVSPRKVPGVPFKKGHDPRRGPGPKKGAPVGPIGVKRRRALLERTVPEAADEIAHAKRLARRGGDKNKILSQKAWKKLMRKYASKPRYQKGLRAILRNPNHPDYPSMYKWASEQGYGRAGQSVDVKGSITLAQLIGGSYEEEPKP